jgi:hypothetical protein
MTDNATFISDNYQRGKAERPATLGRLDYAIDRYDFLFQFQIAGFNPV